MNVLNLKSFSRHLACGLCLAVAANAGVPQNPTNTTTGFEASGVPHLVTYSGVVRAPKLPAGTVAINFSVFDSQDAQTPLWRETQSVQLDESGHYKVELGSMSPEGLPPSLFTSGKILWLEAQAEEITGAAGQPRVMLVSVPYAMRAADSETLGGKPASAYVTSDALTALIVGSGSLPKSMVGTDNSMTTNTSSTITGSGTTNYLPLWSGASTIGNSAIYQSGNNIGIGTTTPAAPLSVAGKASINSSYNDSNTGLTVGLGAYWNLSLYNPSTTSRRDAILFTGDHSSAYTKYFELGTDSAVNGTNNFYLYDNVSGTTRLLVDQNGNLGIGTTTPGAKLEVNGTAKFDGAVTFSGGISNTGNVSSTGQLISTAATGTAPLQVSSTTQVGNLNASLLGGYAASYFQPAGSYAGLGANSFSSSQTISAGNLYLPGTSSTGGVIYIGGNPFIQAPGSSNEFLGVTAGNLSVTGSRNVGIGPQALNQVTTGTSNVAVGTIALAGVTSGFQLTALGDSALHRVTTGYNDTGVGVAALVGTTTGSGNTAVGVSAGTGIATGSYNTFLGTNSAANGDYTNSGAIGYGAVVGANDSIVLGGSYTDNNNVVHKTNIGIGTAVPDRPLAIEGTGGSSGFLSFMNNSGTTKFHVNLSGGGLNFAETKIADGRLYLKPGGTVGINTITPSSAYALDVAGDVHVSGTLFAGAKNFKIDDPIDPLHKDLYHASIESSEMMNLYTGNIVLDSKGRAVVKMPKWFEALNGDFRYQLTCLGGFARVYVAKEIVDGQFVIAGGKAGMKVSWQVTGVRHDEWAKTHPMSVEQEKP